MQGLKRDAPIILDLKEGSTRILLDFLIKTDLCFKNHQSKLQAGETNY